MTPKTLNVTGEYAYSHLENDSIIPADKSFLNIICLRDSNETMYFKALLKTTS